MNVLWIGILVVDCFWSLDLELFARFRIHSHELKFVQNTA